MHAGLDFMFGNNPGHQRAIAHLTVVKRYILAHRGTMSPHQVIENYDPLALFPQPVSCHAPDVSRTTRHQNWHLSPFVRSGPGPACRGTLFACERLWGIIAEGE